MNRFGIDKGNIFEFCLANGFSKDYQTSKRYLADMRGVFSDRDAVDKTINNGNILVYEFYEMNVPENPGDLAFGTTITYPGRVGKEYFMTKGHFHTVLDTAEVYLCLNGEGGILMENPEGDWSFEILTPGKMVYVPKRYAHRSVNIGKEPFVQFFCFRADAGHDYRTIETKGYRKLVVECGGSYKIVDNPSWK